MGQKRNSNGNATILCKSFNRTWQASYILKCTAQLIVAYLGRAYFQGICWEDWALWGLAGLQNWWKGWGGLSEQSRSHPRCYHRSRAGAPDGWTQGPRAGYKGVWGMQALAFLLSGGPSRESWPLDRFLLIVPCPSQRTASPATEQGGAPETCPVRRGASAGRFKDRTMSQ